MYYPEFTQSITLNGCIIDNELQNDIDAAWIAHRNNIESIFKYGPAVVLLCAIDGEME